MKYSILSLFLGLLFTINLNGQKALKITIPVPDMQCEECEQYIQDKLWKRVDGILAIDAYWKRKYVRITYAPDRIDTANIKLQIANLGFDAGDEKGVVENRKNLPKCCQKIIEAPKPAPQPVIVKPTPPVIAKPTSPSVPVAPNTKKPVKAVPVVSKNIGTKPGSSGDASNGKDTTKAAPKVVKPAPKPKAAAISTKTIKKG
jgi:copper chaperone CopZ